MKGRVACEMNTCDELLALLTLTLAPPLTP